MQVPANIAMVSMSSSYSPWPSGLEFESLTLRCRDRDSGPDRWGEIFLGEMSWQVQKKLHFLAVAVHLVIGTSRLPTNHVTGADACRRLKYVFWCFIILSYHFNILLCISMYNIIITSRGLENLSLPLSWARVCSSRWTLCASSGRLLLAARTSIHGNWDGFTAVRRAFPAQVWPNPRHFRDYLFYKCETSLSLCAPFSFVPGQVVAGERGF
jgi:hypothetical protein